MKKTMLVLAAPALFAVPLAHAEHAHVHGVAELSIAVDGNMLQLDLDSPLDNLTGFEHAPRNEKEKQALQAAAAKLRKPETLFSPTAAAHCVPQPPQLTIPFTEAKPSAAPAQDSHADVEASFSFRCNTPAALKDIEVTMFDAFPGLQKLKVQLATPRGQSAATLSGRQRKVSW